MAYKVELIPEAKDDFDSLDGAVRKKAAKKIDALAENPFLGKPLGNKQGLDLTGFYKIYVDKKNYRIVYRLIGEYVEVIEVVAIGRRDKEAIYKLVTSRLRRSFKK